MSYVVVTYYMPPAGTVPVVNVYGTSTGSKEASDSLARRLRRTRSPDGGRLTVYKRRLVEHAEAAERLSEVLIS
jgi:hypothetical protein